MLLKPIELIIKTITKNKLLITTVFECWITSRISINRFNWYF